MLDSNSLQQLENSLSLYQETQETLNLVVQNAQAIFGQEWMSKLPTAFDAEPNEGKRTLLKDKATHAVHYYGALAAWQEAHTYLGDPSSTSVNILAERIPVLEYWLALFGAEGSEVVGRVKILYEQLRRQPNISQPQHVEAVQNSQQMPQTATANTVSENITSVVNNSKEQNIVEVQQIQNPKAETAFSQHTASNQEQSIKTSETTPVANKEPIRNFETSSQESEAYISKEPKENIVLEEQNATSTQNILSEQGSSNIISESVVIEEKKDENLIVSVQEIHQQTQSDPNQEIIDPQEVINGPSRIVTQNWDLANFLRQKRLYDDANNWLSAWCIRMENKEKTDYPHYGFIVDVMYDLNEKIQALLENQLLEDLIDQQIPGGRDTLNRLASAIDKELNDLPDDLKISTAEKIKLSAREILGAIDDSDEKEYIGPAPDGFELMDDPYAASTEQILSDFEKTEKEAQDQIDKLNVIDENENK